MNNDYYYTKRNNGTVYRYRIEQDTDPINPREDYDNACKLYLWWNGYNLGDDKGKDMPSDILNDLIEKYLPDTDEDLYYDKTCNEKRQLLQKASDKVKIFLVFVYEHGGITISMAMDYPFNDRWDSGIGGYVIAEKETFEEYGIDWDKAWDIAEGEVKTYDMYLKGEVYETWEDTYVGNGEWDEDTDICGGYFSNKWGRELATEILGELIPEDEVDEALAEYDRKEKAKSEYGLWLLGA